MKLSISLILLLCCTACIQLGGELLPQQYYLLTPQAENISGEVSSLNLLFNQLEFPAYLDRPQIVTRNQQNELQIAATERWGEPLQDNLVRVLKENLQRRMTGLRISNYPWQPTTEKGLLLKLTINQFDGTLGQQTNVDIRWSLSDPVSHQVFIQNQFIAKIPIGNRPADLVSGLSQATDQLSAAISQELVKFK